ncbi:DUF3435 domain protein [Zalerion maritima]|uniref:DUF3435 domain protein n=1 Tax=Zalerion maritima TaxID=339359 RepID=A0AAD5RJE9_9PEZI|nr:DUF3435 domain protein [Zalerion maritima]
MESNVEKETRPATLRDALFGEEVEDKDNLSGGNKFWEKSDDALTAAIFNSHSERLRIKMGLLEKMAQCC